MRRTEIVQEIARLDNFIAMHQEFSGLPTHGGQTGQVRALKPHKLKPIIREILLEFQRPMIGVEIFTALVARGITLDSEKPTRYMQVMLWRARDEFVNIEGEGYWPRDIPCQAVEYVPTEIEEAFNSTPAEGGSPH
jgi:hypothetical protein